LIYFTSDFHFNHNKSFIYEPRGFKTIEEMNEAILSNMLNAGIQPDDTVFLLGDLMLNDNTKGMEYLRQLPSAHYCIVLGNHDTSTREMLYRSLPFVDFIGFATNLNYKGYHFYCSHYPAITLNHDYDKPLKARTINLCGHNHTTDKWIDWDKGYIYHVELDAHDNKPITIDQIIEDLKQKVSIS